jgi:beta-lactamase class A
VPNLVTSNGYTWKNLTTALALGLVVHTSASAEALKQPDLTKMEALSGGKLGAYAVHLESGQTMSLNSDHPFPMASVVKLAIAIAFLKRVDEGKYALDEKVHLSKQDTHPIGHSPLSENFPAKGLDMSYRDLLLFNICESDTTAGDVLLDKAGGPKAVQKVMDDNDAAGIKIKASETDLFLDYSGVKQLPIKNWDKTAVESLVQGVSAAERSSAAKRFLTNPQNTATPHATANLLSSLQRGKLLKPRSTEVLLQLLTQTNTFPHRIKGLLPQGTTVAHKTGTWGTTDGINAATNDAGIITLPNKHGHVVVAVFIEASNKPVADRELAIATFTKAAYDRWLGAK